MTITEANKLYSKYPAFLPIGTLPDGYRLYEMGENLIERTMI